MYGIVPPEGAEYRLSVAPAQSGPLLEAVTVGVGFTTAVVEAVAVQPSTSVTITVYIPSAFTDAEATVGCSIEEENIFGPSHKKV